MARVFISHSSRDKDQAARLLEWVRSHGFVEAFLDFDKHAGLAPGGDWERTLYNQIAGAEAVILVLTRNWFDSKWCFAEFTQARALGKVIFPVVDDPRGEGLVSPDIQHLDLLADREGGLERLRAELVRVAVNARSGFPWDKTRPPFPGLLAFDEGDAAIYFGRDDDIRRLIERLNARRALGGPSLVALLGASGSGKSSLLRAGVVPRLKRDKRNWIVLPPFRPQLHPIDELAQAVATGLGAAADWRKWRDAFTAGDLKREVGDLARDLRAAHGANEGQILVSIDQGEELFGAAATAESERFFTVLDAMLGEGLPFLAVLALRSDFLGQLQEAPGLTAGYEEFSLKPMPLDRVRNIIEEPARVAGLAVENDLVIAAMKDAATDDALPLLAFALRELYDRHAGARQLSLAHYRDLGDDKEALSPLENAVRRRADEVLAAANPTPEDLQALKEAFVPAMVRVNAAGEYVRRPARLDAVPSRARPLIERLAKARLLTVRQEGAETMVEVAHEALLRKWRRLRGWLDEEREFLIGKDQLERDLHDWDKAPDAQKDEALLTGLKLTRARAWLVDRPQQLADAERRFIRDSVERHEAIRQRQERLQRYVRYGAIAGAAVLGVAAAVAFWQATVATTARQLAERSYTTAVRTAADIVNVIDVSTDSFAINPKMAQKILDVTGDTFDKLVAEKDDPVAIRAQVQLLEVRARSYLVLGNLAAALSAAKASNARARAFAEKGPGNVEWQTIVANSYRRLGDIGQEAGTLDAALEARKAWNAVADRLAKQFPADRARQADLAYSLEKIGDTLRRQGKIDETIAVYRPAKEILQKLVDAEPGNARWRLELGFAHERMSDVFRARHDFRSAAEESESYWKAFDALTKSDPSNTYWRRGLGLSGQRFGDSLLGLGDIDGAFKRFTDYNGIAGALVRLDRANTEWKRDWAVSFAKLGEAHLARRQPQEALRDYRQFLKIMTELVELDAKNTAWRHDQASAHALIGDALLALSQPDDALAEYRQYNGIVAELRERGAFNASGRRSLALSHQRIAEVYRLKGRFADAIGELKTCLSLNATDELANPTFRRPLKLNDYCRKAIEEITGQMAKSR